MIQIFHADHSSEFRTHVRKAISNQSDMELVGETGNGIRAEQEIAKLHPHMVIMGLCLQGIDGFELLNRLQGLRNRPKIIVVSHNMRDHCIEHAMRCGADYYLLKPCSLPVLLDRVRDLCPSVVSEDPSALQERIGLLLCALGIPAQRKGYRYLADAIRVSCEAKAALPASKLYSQLGLAHGASAASIERAIRCALDCGQESCSKEIWKLLFDGEKRPSCSACIRQLARGCSSEELLHSINAALLHSNE